MKELNKETIKKGENVIEIATKGNIYLETRYTPEDGYETMAFPASSQDELEKIALLNKALWQL